jgi:anti-anti-sigma regulatory factor/HAMP domain-containing protein
LLASSKKRLTVAFALVVALAAFLPLMLASIGNQAISRLWMGKTLREVRAEVREDFFELARGFLNDQAMIISGKLSGVASSLTLLKPYTRAVFEKPEGYAPLNPYPILPELDAQTGQWLTPELSGFSLRLPRGKRLDAATLTKALAAELPLESLVSLKSSSGAAIRAYASTTDGLELVYPWEDFVQAAKMGRINPELSIATGLEPARQALRSQDTIFSASYKDPFRSDRIVVSVLVPIFGEELEPLGVLGADLNAQSLLLKGEMSLRGVPLKLLLLSPDNKLLDASQPLNPKEHQALQALLGDPSTFSSSNVVTLRGVCFCPSGVKHEFGTLVLLVQEEHLESLTSPFKRIFGHQKALLDWFFLGILAAMALIVCVVTYAIKQRIERTLDRFLGAIERLSEGDLSARIPYKGFDELERIAETLNTMAETLQNERGALQEKNEELNLALQRIDDQQEAIVGLSVPILPILERTLLCPLVGILDSARLHQLSERLLAMIQAQKAKRAILDLTGCPYIDTQTAKALTETLRAVRLLGAKGYVVGMRPEVVKAIVNLGVGFEGAETSMSLEVLLTRLAGRSTF